MSDRLPMLWLKAEHQVPTEWTTPVNLVASGQRRRFRAYLYVRQNGRCAYCDTAVHFHMLTFDHVRPRWHDGPDHPDNLVGACWPCNRMKAHFTPADLRRMADRIEELML